MQKERPLGVTILAYWALAGSGIMFAWVITILTPFDDTSTAFSWVRAITVPLGAGYAVYAFIALPMAVFFAWVGIYTLKGHRLAWFANVGMSMATFVQYAILTTTWASNLQNIRFIESLESGFFASQLFFFGSYLSISVLRLYYLFRPNVRDFFGTKSLSVKTRNA